MHSYRNYVVSSLRALRDAREILFGQVLNLASSGEMKEIMDSFEFGDSFQFELKHFEDMQDPNIQRLVALIKDIETTYFDLLDENEVDEEEVLGNDGDDEEDDLPF